MFGEMPRSGARNVAASCASTSDTCVLPRNISDSGSMATTQKMPMPIWVARQPELAMKCAVTAGQIAPAT